ncbi:MAG: hypothetical protein ACRCVV_13935, partial [Shewanella sp.]
CEILIYIYLNLKTENRMSTHGTNIQIFWSSSTNMGKISSERNRAKKLQPHVNNPFLFPSGGVIYQRAMSLTREINGILQNAK